MSDTQPIEALALAPAGVGKTRSTLGSLLRRWLDAVIDSRAQKAELCIKEHIEFVPDEVLQRAGYRRRK